MTQPPPKRSPATPHRHPWSSVLAVLALALACTGEGQGADAAAVCGDNVCAPDESPGECPQDCACADSDAACETTSETAADCGDDICGRDETAGSCPRDCASCGDDICADDETLESCPRDCGYCGDDVCAAPLETTASCQDDCGRCGDGVCTSPESLEACPADCAEPVCGDGMCSTGEACPEDCPAGSNYTLWIHGRVSVGEVLPARGNYDDFSYWGPTDVDRGVNPKAVNWGGQDPIAPTSEAILAALDCFCTGPNWCHIAVHSTGDLQIGYALALQGQSERQVRDGVPDAAGVCGTSGAAQTGWNLRDVWVAGGVSGGSDIAGISNPVEALVPLDDDLVVEVARHLYDHNNTAGHTFHRYAGSRSLAATAGLLPGEDDGAVAYHSSGGLSQWGAYCNPTDSLLLCGGPTEPNGYLYPGTRGSTLHEPGFGGGETPVAKWTHHTVEFLDEGANYDHFGEGQWRGITGRMLPDVALASQ